jgi:hypothetical protein
MLVLITVEPSQDLGFCAEVRLGRDRAVRTGFVEEKLASTWANMMAKKIEKQHRDISKLTSCKKFDS